MQFMTKMLGVGSVMVLLATSSFATSVSAQAATKDIVDTAVAAGSFKTLAAALQAAGLVETLKGKGPFTVFAPTDAAFAKLPAGTVEDLLKPENKAKLTAILTYHVVPGEVKAAQAAKLPSAKTVNGASLTIHFFYYGWFYKNKGATPGKMIFKMKVVDFESGQNIGYGKMFLREFVGKFCSALILGFGFFMIAWRQDKRGLHDLIAGTQVIRRV